MFTAFLWSVSLTTCYITGVGVGQRSCVRLWGGGWGGGGENLDPKPFDTGDITGFLMCKRERKRATQTGLRKKQTNKACTLL